MLIGVATLAIRLALLPVWGVPQPSVHDEFSYLLAADTFAHGRLTNPPHPMWIHFEGFHIIQQPTYMSMYPPGQGLILAAGQLLGNPWVGQLLATAAMCSCLCWMLQAWVPPVWALLGAGLCALQVAIPTYWLNSYFATSLPAIGGMLALGAVPRIQRRARIFDAVLLGLGLAVLANTRPYEGLVFSLPIGVAQIVWLFRGNKKFSGAIVIRRLAIPLALVLAVTGVAMCYYFWRVTGNPFEMPYQVNRQTYAVAPYFVWGKPKPEPVYHHAEMRDFYVNWEMGVYRSGTNLSTFVPRMLDRAERMWFFFVGPVFTLPLIAFPYLFRDRKMRLPLAMAGTVLLGNVVEIWSFMHYLAPALGLFFLLLVQCIRHLSQWTWHGKRFGRALAHAIPLACLITSSVHVSALVHNSHLKRPPDQKRQVIARELQEMPGKQLVIVHNGPKHSPHDDWIYNRADIDASKVVWGRDMGPEANRELLSYFRDRQILRLYPDESPPRLVPYTADPSAQ
ncbi:MAG TPA: hypothetical protein VMH04_16380 [Candidatus Solibacter sp.]|nr:hypothetical protein [Candidatus Solibacter sp.]